MIYLIIAIYLLIACFTYFKATRLWDMTKFDRAWISLFWPTIIPPYIVHCFTNKN